MLHSCPNYLFPYEPHFGVPVIKPFSKLFKKMFKISSKTNADVWDSLNFITYFDVKRIAKNNSLNVIFERDVLYKSLLRMDGDVCFSERHAGGVIYRLYSVLKYTRLLKCIKYFPIMLSTPMIFNLAYKKEKELWRK
jgi:hypothetical protein